MWKADPLAGRVLHFGIREHAMGAIMNGIAVHGGTRVFGGTFLTFSDYMRGSVRLAAIMGLPVTYVWTHDSIGLGEDGPTHQPVEHLAALRAIPGLDVVRPGDANETAACNDHETLVEMVDAGMDVARLNFSHGTPEQHAETARACAPPRTAPGARSACSRTCPGPSCGSARCATGWPSSAPATASPSSATTATTPMATSAGWRSTGRARRAHRAGRGALPRRRLVRLRVRRCARATGEVDAVVRVGGTVASRQGLNIPGEVDEFPAVLEDDLDLLHAGEKMGVDIVALSSSSAPRTSARSASTRASRSSRRSRSRRPSSASRRSSRRPTA